MGIIKERNGRQKLPTSAVIHLLSMGADDMSCRKLGESDNFPVPGQDSLNFFLPYTCKRQIPTLPDYAFIEGGCPVVSRTRIHVLPSGSTFDPEVTV